MRITDFELVGGLMYGNWKCADCGQGGPGEYAELLRHWKTCANHKRNEFIAGSIEANLLPALVRVFTDIAELIEKDAAKP